MLKNYSKVEVDELGIKRYFNDKGNHHCLDGPAVKRPDGAKFWVINGKSHRNIDPSDEWWDGEKRWVFKGKYHRIGGSFNFYGAHWYIHGEVYSKKEYYKKVWCI